MATSNHATTLLDGDAPRRASALARSAVLALLSTASLASAAPPGNSAAQDTLRPVYATAADIQEGRRAAESFCAGCHGATGVSSIKGVPHVAGQRPSYLYAKARAYQSGSLAVEQMAVAVRNVSDDALVRITAYYGSLEPATPVVGATKAAVAPDPLAAGKAAAASCAGCHGEAGVSSTPGMPSLAGLDPKYFVAAMDAYRGGQRKHDMMAAFAKAASDTDAKNLALHYALQKPVAAKTPAAGNASAGKAASAACAGCHGEHGLSTNPSTPSLAGQDAQYFVDAMRGYRDGARADETMKMAASGVSDAAVADLAAYYAVQTPKPPKVVKPLALADWVQRCDRCHGVNGNSTDPRTPAIAAQRAEYLRASLHSYQRGERRQSVMAAMSGALTDADVAGLASYYAAQKMRAFVFVPVPAK